MFGELGFNEVQATKSKKILEVIKFWNLYILVFYYCHTVPAEMIFIMFLVILIS